MASCGFGFEVFSVLSASAALRRDSSLWQAGPLRAVNVRRGARARSLLAYAASHGNVARVQELLLLGADPSLPGSGGRTPVVEATAGGHTDVVAILEAAGALPIAPFAGQQQRAIRGHRGPITAAVSADGTLFTSEINSECLRVWGQLPGTGELEPIAELYAFDGLRRRTIVRCVLPLPCGALVAGCNDGSLLVWFDAASPGPRMARPHILAGHRSTTWGLCALPALLPKGRVFASASFDCTVRLWDAGRPAALAVLEGHTDYALAVTVTRNGLLASGSRDRTIRLWDVSAVAEGGAASCVQILTGHTGWVEALATLRCGALASASDDGSVRLWRRVSPSAAAALLESACPGGARDDLVRGRAAQRDRVDAGDLGDSGAWASVHVLTTGVGLRSLAQLIDGSLVVGGLGDAVLVLSPMMWEQDARGQAAEATGTAAHASSSPTLAQAAAAEAAPGLASDAGLAAASHPPPSRVAPQQVVRLLRGHGAGGVHAVVVLADGRLVTGCPQGVLRVWA